MGQKEMKPILVCVDDDSGTLDAVDRVLRRDFDLRKYDSPSAALASIQDQGPPAIVLSDYRMPGMTGVQLLEQVRELAPDTTRAILTGQMDVQELMTAINDQVLHRLILKPWDNDYLLAQMREALQIHALLQEKTALANLAITDPITGIHNHRHFQEVLQREVDRSLRHKRPLSLIMIDVDRFKLYNDTHGHPEGDVALRDVARVLTESIRGIDLLFRYGGEEFAVVLPDTPVEDAVAVAERLRDRVSQHRFNQGSLTLSLGICGLTDARTNPSQLISGADQALYHAKNRGRNRLELAPD